MAAGKAGWKGKGQGLSKMWESLSTGMEDGIVWGGTSVGHVKAVILRGQF